MKHHPSLPSANFVGKRSRAKITSSRPSIVGNNCVFRKTFEKDQRRPRTPRVCALRGSGGLSDPGATLSGARLSRQSTEGCLCSRPKRRRLHLPLSQYYAVVVCWKVFRARGRCSLRESKQGSKGRKEERKNNQVRTPRPGFPPLILRLASWVSSSSCVVCYKEGSRPVGSS